MYTQSNPDPLLNLLSLQFYRLIINKNALPLIRLGLPPLPDLGRKLHHHLLLHALEQYSRRLGRARRHSFRNAKLDGVRVADFERDEFLTRVGGLFCDGFGFDGGAVADADEAEDGGVAFADA